MTGLNFQDLVFQINHYFTQIWAGWQVKLPLSLLAGFYTDHLGGDAVALVTWFAMIVIDLFFGTWFALKSRRFDVKSFGFWVIKLGTHSVVIIIAGAAFRSVLTPLGLNFPLLNLALGILVCTEALSIFKNMDRLGLPVPNLVVRFIDGLKSKAENQAEDFFSRPENNRRRPPNGGDHDQPD